MVGLSPNLEVPGHLPTPETASDSRQFRQERKGTHPGHELAYGPAPLVLLKRGLDNIWHGANTGNHIRCYEIILKSLVKRRLKLFENIYNNIYIKTKGASLEKMEAESRYHYYYGSYQHKWHSRKWASIPPPPPPQKKKTITYLSHRFCKLPTAPRLLKQKRMLNKRNTTHPPIATRAKAASRLYRRRRWSSRRR